jgi:DNA-binding SARP family transcriptional activator
VTIDIQVLGPVRASIDGRPVALGGTKQRAVLALLALRAPEVVSIDQLIDEIWRDEPPKTAEHSVQVYVSELRRLLRGDRAGGGGDVLARRPPGYLLDLEPARVDAHRFELDASRGRALLSAGRPAEAAAALRGALAVWRGRPLADLDGDVARGDVARLEELRVATTEDALEAELALGRGAEAIAELRSLVDEHPTRERVRELLILALYRSGRQADALRELAVVRSVLADELGVDPGPSLRRLEEAILQQDPSLDPPRAPARSAPPASAGEASVEATGTIDSRRQQGRPDEPHELRKIVTVLFVDVSGSTALGDRLDAESMRTIMTRFFDEMRTVLERHGATIEKYVGDAIMAIFGVPHVHEDDAARAVRAAVEMREALSKLNDALLDERGVTIRTRTGINTGEVVADFARDRQRLVTGDAVNVAARLEQSADSDEILLGEATYRLVRDAVDVDVPKHLAVRGKADAVATFRLTGIRPGEGGLSRNLESPMVGRSSEFRALRDAIERTVETGACHLFTVYGEAGVGKSRLIEELSRTTPPEVRTLKGRCLSYGDGITFWPIADAVKQAASIEDVDSRETARSKLDASIGEADDGRAVADGLAQMMGLTDADVPPGTAGWAARRFLESLAKERPLLLLIEDIHWAEPTLLDLIESIAEWSRESPILVVCTARPEFLERRPAWAGGARDVQTLSLRPLSPSDSAELIRNLLGGDAPAGGTVDVIVDAAEGNALFVEQTVSMLIDEGTLRRDEAGWTTTRDISDLRIPAEIQALLSARLDLLPRDERDALECAAVIGRRFDTQAVERLTPDVDRHAVHDRLRALARKDLVRPDGAGDDAGFRFVHALIQAAVYDAIPKRIRALLHEDVADWLEERHGDRSAEYDEIVGRHLERAVGYLSDLGGVDEQARRLAERAAARLSAAGARALVRGDMPAVVALYASVTELMAEDDADRLRILPDLGTAYVEIGDMQTAASVFDEALHKADELDDLGLRSHALLYRFELDAWTKGRPAAEALRDEAVRLIPFAEGRGDDASLYRLWRIVAEHTDSPSETTAMGERAMSFAARAGDRRGQLELLQVLSSLLPDDTTPVPEALAATERHLHLAKGDRVGEAAVIVNARSALLAMIGDIERSRVESAAARATFGDLGLELWLAASATIGPARAELVAGNPELAEELLRAGLDRLHRMSTLTFWLGWELAMLAEALLEQGRVDEAQAALDAGADDPHLSTPGLRGRVLLERERWTDAEATLAEAIERLDAGWVTHVADAHLLRSKALSRLGRKEEAAASAAHAIRLLERKASPLLVARAQRIAAET